MSSSEYETDDWYPPNESENDDVVREDVIGGRNVSNAATNSRAQLKSTKATKSSKSHQSKCKANISKGKKANVAKSPRKVAISKSKTTVLSGRSKGCFLGARVGRGRGGPRRSLSSDNGDDSESIIDSEYNNESRDEYESDSFVEKDSDGSEDESYSGSERKKASSRAKAKQSITAGNNRNTRHGKGGKGENSGKTHVSKDMEESSESDKSDSNSKNKNNKDSSDSDDDDDPFSNPGQNTNKRRKFARCLKDDDKDGDEEDSDSDSDVSAFDVPTKTASRGTEAKSMTDRLLDSVSGSDSDLGLLTTRLAAKKKNNNASSTAVDESKTPKSTKSLGSDFDSDDSFSSDWKIKSRNSTPSKSNARESTGSTPSFELFDSDDSRPKRRKLRLSSVKKTPTARNNPWRRARASTTPTPKNQEKKTGSDKGAAIVDILSSSDDESKSYQMKSNQNSRDRDPSIRADSNRALEEAKKARDALLRSQEYHAEDVEVEIPSPPLEEERISLIDTEDADDHNGNSKTTSALASTNPFYSGPFLRLSLRYKHPNNSTMTCTLKLRMDEPLQNLADRFLQSHVDWLPCAASTTSVVVLSFDGDTVDLSKTPQFYEMEDEDMVDAVVKKGDRRTLKIMFRVNGNSNDIAKVSVLYQGTLRAAMETFASKRNVTLSDCRFEFDGEILSSNNTPEDLDLEGNEIVDVELIEKTTPTTKSGVNDVVMVSVNDSEPEPMLVEERDICIETNRNCNKLPRQKSWKVSTFSTLSQLKENYVKYYKSKGCKRVRFYFQNSLMEDESKSMFELGISGGDTLYAMENGKAYTPI